MTDEATRALLDRFVRKRNATRSAQAAAKGQVSGKRVASLRLSEDDECRALYQLAGWVEQQARIALAEPQVLQPPSDTPEPDDATSGYLMLVGIAADTVPALRACDVFRVIDAAHGVPGQMPGFADWLRKHRPDLGAKIDEAIADVATVWEAA